MTPGSCLVDRYWRCTVASMAIERQARATGFPAVGRVQAAEAADEPLCNGVFGYLIGGVPLSRIRHHRDGKEISGRTLVIAQDAIQAVVVIRLIERTIIVVDIPCCQHCAASQARGAQ